MCCRQSILDVAGQVPPEVIQQLLEACQSNSYARVQQQVSGTAHSATPVAACSCGQVHSTATHASPEPFLGLGCYAADLSCKRSCEQF